ncbi:MAG: ABC transporter permease [Gemmatimonadota bacterium]|nr:ABC transporter permease [Gemmatimonadota bacterium]
MRGPSARTIGVLVRKEFQQVRRDRLMLFQMLVMPFVQLLVLANAATFEIRSSPVAIRDESQSSASRGLIARVAASDFFSVDSPARSMDEANGRLLSGEASVILHVPRQFETDLARSGRSPIQIIVSARDGAAAGVIAVYLRAIARDHAAEMTRARDGVAAAEPIHITTRNRYNEQLDYQAFMIPGVLVILVTIIGTMLTSMNIVREKELGTLEQLNATPLLRSEFIAGKLLPFWFIALTELGFGLLLARLVFDLPMRGSLLLLFGSAGLYLMVALGVGLWISTIASTQQQAMFVTFFFLMLNLFMSGLFTPIASMPGWARAAAELVPLKHFLAVMRTILLRGAGPEAIAPEIGALALMAVVVLGMSLRRYSKTAG